MAGIAGCFGSRDEKTIERMLTALDPNGPHEWRIHSDSHMVWGQSCHQSNAETPGHRQPVLNDDKSQGVIASGEIYNFKKIRRRLRKHYPFHTRSAPEVILALYDERGPDGVRDLDGMFALALFDRRRDTFLLARDPLGIQPLYYGYRDDVFYFTSASAALELAGVDEVHEFPPGHYYTPTDGFIRYYRIPVVDKRPLADVPSIGLRIRRVLGRSVQKRLMGLGQGPVGVFCPGDPASFIVAALVAPHISDLHTFSVACRQNNGQESADLAAARRVAAHIKATHHEVAYGPDDFAEVLLQVVGQLNTHDPAVVAPAVQWFLACRLAGRHVPVVLSGAGADELFAGHASMQDLPRAQVNEACRRYISEIHHLNLQHAVRLAMPYNLEVRLPFLDKEMISLAMKIPADLKIKARQQGQTIGKWIFRQAFADAGLLPADLLWRPAPRIGNDAVGAELAERLIDQEELARLNHDHAGAGIDSKEAALYFKILHDQQVG